MKSTPIQKLNENIEQLLQQDERPLTLPEAAEYLGVSKSHLYKLTYQHQITHWKPKRKENIFQKI